MNRHLLMLSAAGMVLASTGAAMGEEGMWTFDNFPVAAVRAQYGLTLDRQWFDRIQGAAVRLNGCSASIVSENGLVLTNHHCVRACAQNLSDAHHNYVVDGYFADARAEEKLCPGMTAEVLDTVADVTARVQKTGAGKTGEDFVKARDEAIAAIEKDGCADKERKFRCQVVELYQGGRYMLYTFRYYKDLRLVAAPEEDMAFFGGDPDNFNFPRYDLDFSFIRLYENARPARTPDHLIWSTAAPKAGELVFVAGNPGATQRLLTADQLAAMRDRTLPATLIRLSELRGLLIRFSSESPENARIAKNLLFGVENSFKALYGREKALVESNVIAEKRAADTALKAKIAADPKLAGQIGDPWAEIAGALSGIDSLRDRYTYLESGPVGSTLYAYAKVLVRAAAEREKPNGARLPDYTDSHLSQIEKGLLDNRPVYPELEKLALEFWLTKLREHLTADGEGTKIFLGKDSPQTLAAGLAKTRLGEADMRKWLWDGGAQAVAASDDPMIRYVLATDPAARAVLKDYRERVEAPIDQAGEKIAKARFAAYGTSVYPDATFSLRLSYGRVAGWTEPDGRTVAPFTTYDGLWRRATGQAPFALPQRWADAKGKVDGATVFDFVTTNDIIGGNSGSPMVNVKAEVIGTAFDGNIHSLGGAFFFDETLNRTVGVSTAAITEALKTVYRQDRLVKELTGK
jgi:hypothetical protein